MFSLSTSWNSILHEKGTDIINEIKDLGFDTVELNFALTPEIVDEILDLKCNGVIKVSSLHNICPLPEGVEPDEASPDYYSMASLDEKERRLAVEAAKNTIAYAKKFSAAAVVLHAGRVQIKDRTRELASLADDRDRFDTLRRDMIHERDEKKGGYLESVFKSLDELVPYAEQMGIALGLENRYYYREIPLIEELEEIFDRFRSDGLYYWHDVGHAEVFDRLGLVRHKDLLDKFSDRLIGMHLHDIIGLVTDHRAPGFGTFDFKILKPYLTNKTIKVLEVHQPAHAEEVRNGARYLASLLG